MLIAIISLIVVLVPLVFVHELGHFLAAKKFGVRSDEFGFGFPPRIVGVQPIKKDGKRAWRWIIGSRDLTDEDKKYDTVYSLNWIPLGGFVKIKGEQGNDAKDLDSFGAKPIWQRCVILSAGVIMNVILAWVLITAGMMIGLPQALEELPASAKISQHQIQIIEVTDGSPAAQADIQMGDVILSVDNRVFEDYKELQTYVGDKQGQSLHYVIKRGSERINKEVKPKLMNPEGTENNRAVIGVSIVDVGVVSYPVHVAVWEGTKATYYSLKSIAISFGELFAKLFHGQSVGKEVAGPVGIAKMAGRMAGMGWSYLLQFISVLSLNLAVLNILPIPALDGGRIVFLIIEKIKGSPIKQETEAMIHNSAFILLLALIAIITWLDISKLGCLVCHLPKIF